MVACLGLLVMGGGASAALGATVEAVAAPPPPLTAFAALPALRGLSMSPDGQRLVGIMNRDGNSVLVTAKWDGSEMRGIMETDNRKFQFSWAYWVNNNRLVVSTHFPSITRGYASVETRSMAMDADGGNIVSMVPPPRDKSIKLLPQIQDRIIDWMPEDGHHVLMSIVEDYQAFAPTVFSVDVDTGKRTQVLGPRRGIWTWITDRQHQVRVGVKQDDAQIEVIARDPNSDNWRTLWRYEALGDQEVTPLAFGKDPQLLYVMAPFEGKRALYTARLDQLDAKGVPKMTLLVASDQRDLGGTLKISRQTGELQAFGVADMGDAAQMFWTEPLKELARGIDQALPGRFNEIHGFSDDGNRYIVASSGNGVPDQIFIGDRKAGKLSLVADLYPGLPPAQMVGKRSINFKARDGLTITGYLTQPKGEAPGGWPLVLLPHGGPISRDDADFDSWTELLASRGYAVLQVNFRGSAGRGDEFRTAGLRRWGMEMQDDLTDGVEWAIAQHWADPKRICAVGASYGGYAALMGAVKTPDLYRCAVSFAGVTNLVDLSRSEGEYLNGQAMVDKQVGNYWNDRVQLNATSPSVQAARIKVPVLLVHGTADRSVPYDQSETMAKALKAAGKDFQFITLPDGDHHLSRQADRLQFFTVLEAFLAQHLGAKPVGQ
jgi:dipeptidyl aminopeptidase/acylaminoacyl peptidase